jgi:hypothetical protein
MRGPFYEQEGFQREGGATAEKILTETKEIGNGEGRRKKQTSDRQSHERVRGKRNLVRRRDRLE